MTGLAQADGHLDFATDVQVREAGIPAGELGTADDGNPFGRMFVRYEDGKALEAPDPAADDLETMLRMDGKARAIEQVLTLPPRWADLEVVPHKDDSGEAEFVREALFRPANAGGMTTPVELVQAQMTSAVTYRKAFFEKVFDLDDEGRVVYRKLAFRPARTCTLLRDERNRSFDGFKQKARGPNGETVDVRIPAAKAFVYVHGQHRNPLSGASEMDTVWSCFEAKQKVRFLWFQLLERNVIPHGILKSREPGRLAELAKLKSGGLARIDPEESLEPFESGGSAGSAFKDAIDWLSSEMSQSVLASFTDLAQAGGKGSYALSRDQSDLFLRSRQAVLREMGASLGSWVFADLVRWNFGPGGRAPLARFSDLAGHDAAAVRELWSGLVGRPPDPRVPQEFVDYLTELVAQALGMDVDRVRRAMEGRDRATERAGGPLVEGIDAAARLLAEAGVVQPRT